MLAHLPNPLVKTQAKWMREDMMWAQSRANHDRTGRWNHPPKSLGYSSCTHYVYTFAHGSLIQITVTIQRPRHQVARHTVVKCRSRALENPTKQQPTLPHPQLGWLRVRSLSHLTGAHATCKEL